MAEIFGTVASAVSVAALFNNCVTCFEYIQLGREFGQDFSRCQLKLDVAKTRMGRWGEAVKINESPRFQSSVGLDETTQRVQEVLAEIKMLFEAAQRSSRRYESNAKKEDLVPLDESALPAAARSVHDKLRALSLQRQKQASFFKKTAWALYDSKSFQRLVDQITGFVDDLEKLVPAETARQNLVEAEIREVQGGSNLLALQEAAEGTDNLLSQAAAKKFSGRNDANKVWADTTSKVRVGNEWSQEALGSSKDKEDHASNKIKSLSVMGGASVHLGHRYGGASIFGDM